MGSDDSIDRGECCIVGVGGGVGDPHLTLQTLGAGILGTDLHECLGSGLGPCRDSTGELFLTPRMGFFRFNWCGRVQI